MLEPPATPTWRITLPRSPTAVPIARAMVRTAMQDLRATADRTTAQLLTAELVTNALRHTRDADPIELVVELHPAGCRIEVHDGDSYLVQGLGSPPSTPAPGTPAPAEAPTGPGPGSAPCRTAEGRGSGAGDGRGSEDGPAQAKGSGDDAAEGRGSEGGPAGGRSTGDGRLPTQRREYGGRAGRGNGTDDGEQDKERDGDGLDDDDPDQGPAPAPDQDPHRAPDRSHDHCRGLLLVRSLSRASGCRPTPRGKAVWFTLPERRRSPGR